MATAWLPSGVPKPESPGGWATRANTARILLGQFTGETPAFIADHLGPPLARVLWGL